ncbi:glutamate-5-semialdehyde dehydrogenase [Dongshaea marina]|uniref:glutamate-5-semialdehyde dehydrogenase n=1 Tax=Dongshaea marina TaxID=2047966 RepID=UPI000D3E1351|nr:glutamate-5-semialdehyde dehydrogenase [Dongshaea marina]
MNLEQQAQAAQQASFQLATLSSAQKNRALMAIADELAIAKHEILTANAKDMSAARAAGTNEAMLDRLLLTEERLRGIIEDVRKVVSLADPVGSSIDSRTLENGMRLTRRRVPLGVIGVIYEARPNVTIDIATLCLKTGNACILRGGKETLHSNLELVRVIKQALRSTGLPEDAVQYIENPDRALISELLKADRYVDMIIPRGGQHLQQLCKEQSTIPVIIGGFGISHGFVDASADQKRALPVIKNAKLHRPAACNALDTLLVHQEIAPEFLPKLAAFLEDSELELIAEPKAHALLEGYYPRLAAAVEGDFDREWLGPQLGVKLVADVDEALMHLREHNASHSDTILTNDLGNAERFINGAGSAAVYVNASTRFTDGAQFGLGAEVAVSTQKLHARGPMGLEALTSYKWVGEANYLSRD